MLINAQKMDAVLLVEAKRIVGIPIRSYSSHHVWVYSSPSAWLPTGRTTTCIAVPLILAMCAAVRHSMIPAKCRSRINETALQLQHQIDLFRDKELLTMSPLRGTGAGKLRSGMELQPLLGCSR